MDPRAFLHVAEQLAKGATEAEWRSATSRAYYAAFHVARRLLLNCGFQVPRADRGHAHVWLRLSNAGDPLIETTGSDIKVLRGTRNQADYQLTQPFSRSEAARDLHTAREIIRCLELASRDPLKTHITEAMKRYERDVLREVTWQPPTSN